MEHKYQQYGKEYTLAVNAGTLCIFGTLYFIMQIVAHFFVQLYTYLGQLYYLSFHSSSAWIA